MAGYYEVDVKKLKAIMLENNIKNVSELSKKSNISSSTLSLVLNNKRRPSTLVMEKLTIALKIPPSLAGEIFFKNKLA